MVVYDFIYTNKIKIHSFYAQLFQGLLTQATKTVTVSTMEFSDLIKNMIVPKNAYTFTPLAIYREIVIDEPNTQP